MAEAIKVYILTYATVTSATDRVFIASLGHSPYLLHTLMQNLYCVAKQTL
jgi:hypothetical protein